MYHDPEREDEKLESDEQDDGLEIWSKRSSFM